MNLQEKLRALRKQAGMSQEQLAKKLHVSRQAVTKWEAGTGLPDLENLRALAALFQLSLDELLAAPGGAPAAPEFLYESITEYDIDAKKDYDISFTGASSLALAGYDGEKLRVRLASNEIAELQSAFKVKLDDIKRRLDVEVRRVGKVSETQARGSLHLFLLLPGPYTGRVDISGSLDELRIAGLETENLEFSGKAKAVRLTDCALHLELNSNEDLTVSCQNFAGQLDLNQISAVSRLLLAPEIRFQAVTKGLANKILYERDGAPCEAFSLPAQPGQDSELVVELNGLKSELVIAAVPQEARQ